MKVLKLNELNRLILTNLKAYPEGLSTPQVVEYVKADYFVVYQRLRRLRAAKIIEQHLKLWKLTDYGTQWMFNALGAGMATAKQNIKEAEPIRTKTKRNTLHATTYYAYPFITHKGKGFYEQVPETLKLLGIPYKLIGNRKAPQYLIPSWKGIKLKFTQEKLIAWGKRQPAPINIKTNILLDNHKKEMADKLAEFTDLTGFRYQETLDGELRLDLKYWECGLSDDEVAQEAGRHNGKIRMAYDRATGELTIWFDDTPDPNTFESNKLHNIEAWRPYMQGIQDEIYNPALDELRTRKEMGELRQFQLENARQLAEYAKQIKLHLKIMKKIDQRLNQRTLREFHG